MRSISTPRLRSASGTAPARSLTSRIEHRLAPGAVHAAAEHDFGRLDWAVNHANKLDDARAAPPSRPSTTSRLARPASQRCASRSRPTLAPWPRTAQPATPPLSRQIGRRG